MFSKFIIILCALLCAVIIAAKPLEDQSKISPTIVNELKDFLDLVPQATIDELVAKHYLIDSDFRTAIKYLRSSAFTALMEQAELTPEVAAILDYLHLTINENLTITIDASTNEVLRDDLSVNSFPVLYFLLNEIQSNARYAYMQVQSFTSFVQELLGHLPRGRYQQMITDKCSSNPAFKEFYIALRSVQLRPMVDDAIKSKNLQSIIMTLSNNAIKVSSLVPIAFDVISWGPDIPA